MLTSAKTDANVSILAIFIIVRDVKIFASKMMMSAIVGGALKRCLSSHKVFRCDLIEA